MAKTGLDRIAMARCRRQLNTLSKPPGSLGRLEEYAVKLAGIRHKVGGRLRQKTVLVFAADNGVCAQEITPVPQITTALQSDVIAKGLAGVSVLARLAGAKVCIYDIGVGAKVSGRVRDWNVMRGTHDITKGAAMSRTEFDAAFSAGRNAVAENEGSDIFGIGETGICNTTTAAAVASVLLNLPPEEVTGPGTGTTAAQLEHKIACIREAVAVNHPDAQDPRDVVAKVGGLDIAAMAGAYLECAKRRLPVVIDGMISACAALVAARLRSAAADYMFASHMSPEPAFSRIMEELHLEPPLDLQMRLGEGSGCPFMFEILDGALAVVEEMGTLEAAQIDAAGFADPRHE